MRTHRAYASIATLFLVLALGLGLVGMIGCASAPSKIETALFEIRTNYIPTVITQTNYIPVTNTVTAFVTNTLNQVIDVPVTLVTVRTNVEYLTNIIETTVWTTKTNITTATGTAGAIINTFAPGIGSLVTAIIGGLLGIWGTARSKNPQIDQAQKVAASLAQIIEVGRNILANTPQGTQAAEAWKNWMIQHQAEQGVIQNVITLLEQSVNSQEAKAIADQLRALMAQVKS